MHPAASLIDKNFVKTTLFKPKDLQKSCFHVIFYRCEIFFCFFFFSQCTVYLLSKFCKNFVKITFY